jgi:ribosome-associated translation inhibitor RaiA
MSRLDFHVEVYNELPQSYPDLIAEAETRLLDLAGDQDDMIGASIALEELAGEETPHAYQVRIVAYIKPDNVVAVEKAETVEIALRGALVALERQVRDLRERLRRSWKRPERDQKMNLYELAGPEIYDAFVKYADPAQLIEEGHTWIADRLILEEKLEPEEAYYAADQILVVAQETLDAEQRS